MTRRLRNALDGPEGTLVDRACAGCGGPLPQEDVMCSISHTIRPGAKLCVECGQRESTDSLWADGQRVGWLRSDAAEAAVGKLQEVEADLERADEANARVDEDDEAFFREQDNVEDKIDTAGS